MTRNDLSYGFVAILLGCGCSALPGSELRVLVYNQTELTHQAVRTAVEEASRIMKAAEIPVHWVLCDAKKVDYRVAGTCEYRRQDEESFHVFLMPESSDDPLQRRALGYVLLEQGERTDYAKVFPSRVKTLARRIDAPVVKLLGSAIAHELGHLFLQSNEHAAAGVMKAGWNLQDAEAISTLGISFDPQTAARIRSRLSVRKRR